MQQKSTMLSRLLFTSMLVATTVHARDFRSADVHPADYPTVQAVQYFGQILKEKSQGKYGVKVFGGSVLGSEKETVDQVKMGALDMVRVNTGAFHSTVPEAMVPSFPFLFQNLEHFRKTMYGPIGDKILAGFEKAGYIGLVLWESGARSMYAKKPIRTLADVKGMRIRVQQSELWMSLAQAMGAIATPIPMAEVQVALNVGLVDAAENNYPSYESAHHYLAAPVYSETQHVMAPEVLVFSKKVWDTLSKDDQRVIREAAKESTKRYIQLWSEKEQKSKKAAEAAGAKFVSDVNKSEFVAAMKPVWDKFSKTPELKALVKEIMETK